MSLVNPRRPQLEQQQQPQTQQPQQLAAGSGLPPAGMFSGMAAAGGLARAPATTRRDRPAEAQVAQVLPPPRTAGAIPPLQAQAAQQQQQQFDMGADARGTARYYRGGAAPAPLPAGREAQGVAATGAAAPSQGAAAQRERGTTPPGAAAQQHAQAALLAALMPGRHGTPAMPPGTVLDQPVYLRANGATYIVERVIGNGSFGVVLQARTEGTGEVVAIKRVLQDKRYKNRELQIMRMLRHPNVVDLRNSFYVNGAKPEEVYLNLVQEFVPETVYKTCRDHVKRKIPFPHILVKLYIFQLCRALAYIHSMGACHRDIKPQNLLVDTQSGVLKLCDFGSAKVLQRGESNVSYICSRYYRAPELIFGATNYTTAIDIWSAGCVMAELLLGQPLFPGESGVDQLVEIIKVLGTPTHEQIQSMNRNYPSYNFPDIKPHPWSKVLRPGTPPEAVDLIGRVLLYSPQRRPSASELCVHPFFDELRQSDVRLPNGNPLPSRLLDFTPEEIASAAHLGISRERLMGGSTVGAGAQPFSQPAIGGSASTATALPMLPHTQPQQAPPPQMQDEMSTVP